MATRPETTEAAEMERMFEVAVRMSSEMARALGVKAQEVSDDGVEFNLSSKDIKIAFGATISVIHGIMLPATAVQLRNMTRSLRRLVDAAEQAADEMERDTREH